MLTLHRTGLISLFLAFFWVNLSVSDITGLDAYAQSSQPRALLEREDSCIALGTCPDDKPGALLSSPPLPPSRVARSALTTSTATPSNRTLCSPDECPKYCQPGSNKIRRSFLGGFSSLQALRKRFFEPSAANQLVNELLSQSYTSNLSPDPSKYEWHAFGDKEYASAIKGLCGCTAIIAASSKGVFTAHVWEEDPNTNGDLQPGNYKTTVQTLSSKLSPHKSDLANGEAWIMLPSQPNNSNRDLYPAEIVTAIKNAVSDASGLTPKIVSYVPLDWKKSPTLGTNQRGTAAAQYDPAYKPKPEDSPVKAYRLWMESTTPISEKTF